MKKFYPSLVIILTLLLIIVVGCKSLPNIDYPSNPNETLQGHLITKERALTIKQQYDSLRLDLFEDKLKDVYHDDFEDTQFVWISLDKMKAYIKYLERIQRKNRDKDVSGIRVYFAAYPNRTNEKYPGNQTSFMVPTVKTNFNDPEFNIMNHLPFVIQPYTPNDPIKGDFIPLENLMIDYKKEDRMTLYNKTNGLQKTAARSSQAISSSTAAAAQENNTTKTILNEFNLAPPPKDDE